MLINVTKDMSPALSFPIAGVCIFAIGVFAVSMVKERKVSQKVYKLNNDENLEIANEGSESVSRWKQAGILTRIVYNECKTNIMVIICLIGAVVIRLIFIIQNIYTLLWILSFIQKGVLESELEAKLIFRNINLITIAVILVCFKFIWEILDSIPSYV